jgi:hypothetical protein
MSTLWPAFGIDMRFFSRQGFKRHSAGSTFMQRGIATMNWWQLYLQPQIVCATRCQAEQVHKGHRDMCARAWRMSFSCYGQLDESSRAEACICDLIRHVLGTGRLLNLY